MSLLERLANDRADRGGFRADDLREITGNLGLRSDPVTGKVRRHEVGSALLHQRDDFIGHERAVLDRIDSGQHRTFHPFGAVSVNGHDHAVIVSGLDDRSQFLFGELRILTVRRQTEHAAGGRELDEIGSVFVSLTHRLASVIRAVDDSFERPGIATVIAAQRVGRIGMAAGCGERLARREDAWSRHPTFVDRLAQSDRVHAVVSQVTHCREAGQQRLASVHRRTERVVRLLHEEPLGVRVLRVLRLQVRVHVHQAGHHGFVGQRDELVPRLWLDETLHDARDAALVDHDRRLAARLVIATVDKPAGVNDGRRLRGDRQRKNCSQQQDQTLQHGNDSTNRDDFDSLSGGIMATSTATGNQRPCFQIVAESGYSPRRTMTPLSPASGHRPFH
ncbi:MAG: hypothetical protein FD138_990 [Planctomycetota bacterium]|nr:MAG: hypothetical protein FD138_990 [Planctomycetota bacterium]